MPNRTFEEKILDAKGKWRNFINLKRTSQDDGVGYMTVVVFKWAIHSHFFLYFRLFDTDSKQLI